MNDATREALEQKLPVFPLLEVAWTKRGSALGTIRYAAGGATLDDGAALGVVVPGGFREIEYGTGLKGSTLQAATTSVTVVDASRQLASLLYKYEPRNSPATIRYACPRLVPADWAPLFTGIVYDWRLTGTHVELLLRTDDAAFKAPFPRPAFERAVWSEAFDPTIYGTSLPLLMGIHDTYQMTNRGMASAINVRWSEDTGYWWLASMGNLKSVKRIYFDGAVQPSTSWTTLRGVYGGVFQTLIGVYVANKPADGNVVVTMDCEGPDENGGPAGATLTNPIKQLRACLQEYVLRENWAGAWLGAHERIDNASWNAVAAYFDDAAPQAYECGRVFGGEQGEGNAVALVDSVLAPYPWLRAIWTEEGKLKLCVLRFTDAGIDAARWIEANLLTGPGRFVYEPGDRAEVYSHIRMAYMSSTAEQKFEAAYEAHDRAALDEPVMALVENRWSQARYSTE